MAVNFRLLSVVLARYLMRALGVALIFFGVYRVLFEGELGGVAALVFAGFAFVFFSMWPFFRVMVRVFRRIL